MTITTSVISIQSQVVHGHVGNSAAILPMQAHGLNVAAVPTTLLPNHPGFETMRGRVNPNWSAICCAEWKNAD
ncbi:MULTISPECIES: hypothetical protein [Brucella/Ochrobactrum group]|uniref:hypothetical protein n=1 Tax=Brucella/Ochrobactrum group TaxID=2826938 RepID=UPI001F15EC98|nr:MULTISPECIES: hypothetical protein [Brucella]WHS29930.1 hypothetical protein QLQ09_05915 [Brucella sp. NM4]WHT44582.1 hypothetical protein QLQ11_22540 [Ochrobactrum sp. SSR]